MKKIVVLLVLFISSLNCYVMAQNEKISENEFLKKVFAQNVCFTDKQVSIESLPWNQHPTFKGVSLKHLVNGSDTGGTISCHIVRIDPGCVLDTHKHDGKVEIHEVISGDGTIFLDGKEINYSVGRICVIPANTLHKVVAGEKGLYLFAKFSPAL